MLLDALLSSFDYMKRCCDLGIGRKQDMFTFTLDYKCVYNDVKYQYYGKFRPIYQADLFVFITLSYLASMMIQYMIFNALNCVNLHWLGIQRIES